ncbi:hypothetical protein RND71_012748 [Anisodus tanguticus]|uniref:SBP-type domain-containing protein n=1 Tax=Anisodus tanguticus TaxID=243964 RepID=A0AAE1SFW2_9SOLA|nr:hypothetical protein RND71_012748 [Anisodus tanguticus]
MDSYLQILLDATLKSTSMENSYSAIGLGHQMLLSINHSLASHTHTTGHHHRHMKSMEKNNDLLVISTSDDAKRRNITKNNNKKGSSNSSSSSLRSCQAEKCSVDLSGAKQYHKRHKVCEYHAKSQVVVVAGFRQRFCQQCSRQNLTGRLRTKNGYGQPEVPTPVEAKNIIHRHYLRRLFTDTVHDSHVTIHSPEYYSPRKKIEQRRRRR